MTNCFHTICTCNCFDELPEFDKIVTKELKIAFTLNSIVRQNIGWFMEKGISDHHLENWSLGYGLYFLWDKEDYCAEHGVFHMTCKYVGKGHVGARLKRHWSMKTFDHDIVYFTYVELENRLAKYIEQLLLDIYRFPYNKCENTGQHKLCAYFTQDEVD